MIRRTERILLLAALAFAAVVVAAGCSSKPLQSDTSPPVEPVVAASADATTQAQTALEQLFVAMNTRDVARFNSLVTTSHASDDGGLRGFVYGILHPTRMEAGKITPVEIQPGDPGYGNPDVRIFSAPVRFWGEETVEDGQRQDWTWDVVRGTDGRWRVSDWGSG